MRTGPPPKRRRLGPLRGLGFARWMPVVLAALLLAIAGGCGLGSDPGPESRSSKEPTPQGTSSEEVAAAVAKLLDDSFRISGSFGTKIEEVEASPAVDSFVTQQPDGIAFDGEYERAGRFVVEPKGGPTLTFYDGDVYATTAGGAAARLDADDSDRQALADVPALLEASVERAALKEVGVEELAGSQVRHYSGTTDGTALRDAYARASSFAQVPPPDEVLAVEGARADFYVDEATGDLVRQTEEASLVLDFGELGLGADGIARVVLTRELDFTDHGDEIVVLRP